MAAEPNGLEPLGVISPLCRSALGATMPQQKGAPQIINQISVADTCVCVRCVCVCVCVWGHYQRSPAA